MPIPFPAAEAARHPPLIGCDEVGRGALCGPVVVAAVFFDPCALPPALLEALDDSKRLTREQREAVADALPAHARLAFAAGAVAAIDTVNIRQASLDAMARAVRRLGLAAPVAVDGQDVPPLLAGRCRAVVGGDGKVPQIAAASILAKVLRDRMMARLHARYPDYGWVTNVGYSTATHLAALQSCGPSPHHRRSFAPVAAAAIRLRLAPRLPDPMREYRVP
ncbi:ribonuclease HII [Siccirubricoccus phaeus]|uniref:ribonuclease HII n=1 Tax=Siccirubricoccus phaeus TaxID=2595053 RepID=UPI0011F3074E|nr:ribonuclease HII [Siccirubricoccus phaeus]